MPCAIENPTGTPSVPEEDLGVSRSNRFAPTIFEATMTPPTLARHMVDIVGIRPGDLVLEPSAGDGALARPARDAGGKVTCVELNAAKARALMSGPDAFTEVHHADFIRLPVERYFDVVVMNPPREAFKHVVHARKFLELDGRLIALVHLDVAESLQKALPEDGDVWPIIGYDFQIEGKSIAAALFTFVARWKSQ